MKRNRKYPKSRDIVCKRTKGFQTEAYKNRKKLQNISDEVWSVCHENANMTASTAKKYLCTVIDIKTNSTNIEDMQVCEKVIFQLESFISTIKSALSIEKRGSHHDENAEEKNSTGPQSETSSKISCTESVIIEDSDDNSEATYCAEVEDMAKNLTELCINKQKSEDLIEGCTIYSQDLLYVYEKFTYTSQTKTTSIDKMCSTENLLGKSETVLNISTNIFPTQNIPLIVEQIPNNEFVSENNSILDSFIYMETKDDDNRLNPNETQQINAEFINYTENTFNEPANVSEPFTYMQSKDMCSFSTKQEISENIGQTNFLLCENLLTDNAKPLTYVELKNVSTDLSQILKSKFQKLKEQNTDDTMSPVIGGKYFKKTFKKPRPSSNYKSKIQSLKDQNSNESMSPVIGSNFCKKKEKQAFSYSECFNSKTALKCPVTNTDNHIIERESNIGDLQSAPLSQGPPNINPEAHPDDSNRFYYNDNKSLIDNIREFKKRFLKNIANLNLCVGSQNEAIAQPQTTDMAKHVFGESYSRQLQRKCNLKSLFDKPADVCDLEMDVDNSKLSEILKPDDFPVFEEFKSPLNPAQYTEQQLDKIFELDIDDFIYNADDIENGTFFEENHKIIKAEDINVQEIEEKSIDLSEDHYLGILKEAYQNLELEE